MPSRYDSLRPEAMREAEERRLEKNRLEKETRSSTRYDILRAEHERARTEEHDRAKLAESRTSREEPTRPISESEIRREAERISRINQHVKYLDAKREQDFRLNFENQQKERFELLRESQEGHQKPNREGRTSQGRPIGRDRDNFSRGFEGGQNREKGDNREREELDREGPEDGYTR